MNNMIREEQQKQFSEILTYLAQQLDVTESEFKTITTSYEAVGSFLAENDSPLKPYKPSIHPQGSFLLGTVVRPICEEDDLDIDLVCELERIPDHWTQYDLKNAVGDRLKSRELYKKMLDEEGKRCWTLLYGDNKYHMDVLPSLVCDNYYEVVTRYFSTSAGKDPASLAIHITDNTREDYRWEKNKDRWMISNPFGYAQWFLASAQTRERVRDFSAEAKIDPVPKYSADRFVLQRVVQLLKRHRDIMFDSDAYKSMKDYKPISIIITTLATETYNQEQNLYKALRHIADHMAEKVEDRNGVKWVANPVNKAENFADRWPGSPRKQMFDAWINKLRSDMDKLEAAVGNGLDAIKEVLGDMFGERVSNKTYEKYGKSLVESRKNGNMRISATGTLGLAGALNVAAHSFYGSEET